MATKDLTFDLYGRDRTAGRTMRTTGTNAEKMGRAFRAAGRTIAIGLAAGAAALTAFGVTSVRAFGEAQESQNRLTFAYEKFPAAADVNIESLRKLNSILATKTRYDDDATAASQASLLQYGLTGAQIVKLTPLLQDYAAATGKDLVTASEDLGKALMGQGRTLKAVGIDFTDAGSVAANFDQIIAALSEKVGGFAEKDATTAAGRLEILTNRFGETQEKVGEALLPALEKLMDFFESDVLPGLEDVAAWIADTGVPQLQSFVNWVGENSEQLPFWAAALVGVTVAQWGLNAAMYANPIGATVAAIGGLLAIIGELGALMAWAANDFGSYSTWVQTWASEVTNFIKDSLVNLANFGIGAVNVVIDFLNAINTPLREFANFIAAVTGIKLDVPSISHINPLGISAVGGYNTTKNASIVNPGLVSTVGAGAGGGKAPLKFAEGGYVPHRPGGLFANIGEGRYDELVLPLSPEVLGQLGGRGDSYSFSATGTDPNQVVDMLMQKFRSKVRR